MLWGQDLVSAFIPFIPKSVALTPCTNRFPCLSLINKLKYHRTSYTVLSLVGSTTKRKVGLKRLKRHGGRLQRR